jgi:type II secretory pathway component PulK
MKIGHQPPRQGIALIIVLISVVTLSILVGNFASSMKVETTLARNSSMDSELEWMARSGVELAKYVLSQTGQGGMQFEALNQKWAGGTGDTNSLVADLPLDDYKLGRGRVSVKIVDLERKFNINTITPANSEVLGQALLLIGVDAAEKDKIKNAILDWMDPKTTGSRDTGDSYYMSLPTPYRAKHGPFDDITELMRVRYIRDEPDMFYGSGQSGQFSRGQIHRPGLGRSALERPTYPVGFVDLFTTLSSGRVNINTASATVLQCIPEVEESLAQAIIGARAAPEDPPEGVEGRMAFRSVQEIQRVPGMPPFIIGQLARYCDVRSTTFEVQVEASIGNYKRHYTAVLRRDGNKLQTLFMYWN